MNCNVEITAVGTADGLEVSIHGGSVGMMTAAELIVARVLMAVADDEENLAGLKDSMFEIINEMVKDCWAEKTAKTEAEKEAAVNQLKAFGSRWWLWDSLKSLPASSTIPTIPAGCVSTRSAWQRRQWNCAGQITLSKSATGMKFLQRRSCMIIARWASTAIRETVSTNILTPVWWATEKEASLWHSSISS